MNSLLLSFPIVNSLLQGSDAIVVCINDFMKRGDRFLDVEASLICLIECFSYRGYVKLQIVDLNVERLSTFFNPMLVYFLDLIQLRFETSTMIVGGDGGSKWIHHRYIASSEGKWNEGEQ